MLRLAHGRDERCPVLALAMAALLVLAGCARSIAADRRATAERTGATAGRSSVTNAALEREVFELVNRYRRGHSLPGLELDERISREARRHSAAMAAGSRRLGHAGFDDRVDALRRVTRCRRSAENVAFNRGHREPAAHAVRGWLGSRGHRQNIEGRYEATGIGVVVNAAGEVYLTQIFVGR